MNKTLNRKLLNSNTDFAAACNETMAQAEEIIAKMNEGIQNKISKADMESLESKLKEVEKEYLKDKTTLEYQSLHNEENPIKAVLSKKVFYTLNHEAKREDGVLVGYELTKNKMVYFDLVKFFETLDLSTMWKYKAEKFSTLLSLKISEDLGIEGKKADEVAAKIGSTISEKSFKTDIGDFVPSNNELCRQLQGILDDIYFEDDGNGKNVYKANNFDVKYMLYCFTSKGRGEKSAVRLSRSKVVFDLISDTFNQKILNHGYDLEISAGKNLNVPFEYIKFKAALEAEKSAKKSEPKAKKSRKSTKKSEAEPVMAAAC